ncbi:MAG: class I SAM-dependent methyltransferase [Dehalococcoidia bacterium]
MSKDPSARQAQEQFGRQAQFYAESDVHRAGESLESVIEYAALGRYETVVDLATGAGFTAFAMAPYSSRVLATDIAPGMLAQARRLAVERGLDNVSLSMAEAETLPFATDSLDAVTCRQAAHHFHNLPKAVEEVRRALKPGAVFILSDTVAPEGDPEAQWINDKEVRRDASHQTDLKPSEWRSLLESVGFELTHSSMAKVYLEFNDWVMRSATPEAEVEALRRDFISAPASVTAAFGIQPNNEEIDFYWDVLVVRAVKR